MNSQRIGYVRVSTVGQNSERQLHTVEVDKIFEDSCSGKSGVERPALEAMIDYVREGDTVFVHSMDRLSRSLKDLRETVDTLTGKGVEVRFLKEGLTFTGDDSSVHNLLLGVLGAVAEFEHSLIRERQLEGIAIAKKAGKYKGRKKGTTKASKVEVLARIAKGESKASVARELGISRQTLYTYLSDDS